MRLSENAHLPFDKLTVLSKVEGLCYPHPSSLRRTSMYASLLGISEALQLDIFHQPLRSRFFDSLPGGLKLPWADRHSLEGPKNLRAALKNGAQSEIALMPLFCQY